MPRKKEPDPPMTDAEMREHYRQNSSISSLYNKARLRQPGLTKDDVRRVIFGG